MRMCKQMLEHIIENINLLRFNINGKLLLPYDIKLIKLPIIINVDFVKKLLNSYNF